MNHTPATTFAHFAAGVAIASDDALLSFTYARRSHDPLAMALAARLEQLLDGYRAPRAARRKSGGADTRNGGGRRG